MADTTEISWCDRTWSPWEGCTKVSVASSGGGGCDNCYAEAMNKRFRKGANWGPGAPRRLTADWTKPVLWNRQAAKAGRRFTVFPSICDPFDNEVPPEWRTRFYELVNETPHLTWLLLTKRIGNVEKMAHEGPFLTLPNVWLGATVVNQMEADRDVPKLLALPARVRFLSVEPMLAPIDLGGVPDGGTGWHFHPLRHIRERRNHSRSFDPESPNLERESAAGLHWVICGGESGPKARPMNPEWVRSLRDQCAAAGVPFHFKQWGEWSGPGISFPDGRPDLAKEDNAARFKVGAKAAGRLLDGIEHLDFPRSNP